MKNYFILNVLFPTYLSIDLIVDFFFSSCFVINGWCVVSCMVDENVELLQHPTTQREVIKVMGQFQF